MKKMWIFVSFFDVAQVFVRCYVQLVKFSGLCERTHTDHRRISYVGNIFCSFNYLTIEKHVWYTRLFSFYLIPKYQPFFSSMARMWRLFNVPLIYYNEKWKIIKRIIRGGWKGGSGYRLKDMIRPCYLTEKSWLKKTRIKWTRE